jgi:hypothetical protein
MTWCPPWGTAEVRCDHRDEVGYCAEVARIKSSGSHQFDRDRLKDKGWSYRPLVGDLCPLHTHQQGLGNGRSELRRRATPDDVARHRRMAAEEREHGSQEAGS